MSNLTGLDRAISTVSDSFQTVQLSLNDTAHSQQLKSGLRRLWRVDTSTPLTDSETEVRQTFLFPFWNLLREKEPSYWPDFIKKGQQTQLTRHG